MDEKRKMPFVQPQEKKKLSPKEKKFVHGLLVGKKMQDVAKEVGVLEPRAMMRRPHVMEATLVPFQRLSVKWQDLLSKGKNRLELILDDPRTTDKDVIAACREIFQAVIKGKAVHLQEAAAEQDEDPIAAILGEVIEVVEKRVKELPEHKTEKVN